MKRGMSDGEWLACICNCRTPLMLNDKKRKARDKYKLKRLTWIRLKHNWRNLNTIQIELKCNCKSVMHNDNSFTIAPGQGLKWLQSFVFFSAKKKTSILTIEGYWKCSCKKTSYQFNIFFSWEIINWNENKYHITETMGGGCLRAYNVGRRRRRRSGRY